MPTPSCRACSCRCIAAQCMRMQCAHRQAECSKSACKPWIGEVAEVTDEYPHQVPGGMVTQDKSAAQHGPSKGMRAHRMQAQTSA